MSMIASAVALGGGFLRDTVTDPTATAPDGLKTKVNLVLGMVKWASLMGVLGLWLAGGLIVMAADRGHGAGLSPELKATITKGGIALVLVATAAQIVNFVIAPPG